MYNSPRDAKTGEPDSFIPPVNGRLRCDRIAAAQTERTLSGTILTARNEAVACVAILFRNASGEHRAKSDAAGNFRLRVQAETLSLRFFGRKIALVSKTINPASRAKI